MAKVVIPKTLGTCADKLYKLKQERAALTRKVKAIEEQESVLRKHIMEQLPAQNAKGISGKVARVEVQRRDVPQVSDWPKFYGFVKKNSRFDLMQRRLSEPAIKEMWEAGKKVPGVQVFHAEKISLTKK